MFVVGVVVGCLFQLISDRIMELCFDQIPPDLVSCLCLFVGRFFVHVFVCVFCLFLCFTVCLSIPRSLEFIKPAISNTVSRLLIVIAIVDCLWFAFFTVVVDC